MDEDREALALLLLREGSTDQAVEMYREETGASYFEAKRTVDELATRNGLRGSVLGPWVLALCLISWFVGFLLAR